MPNFLQRFDGSGREPRNVQRQALEWLSKNWDKKVLAIQAPTGSGKSAIARAIQLVTEADIVIPSNMLMDQYTSLYAGTNALKGQHKYQCGELPLSCGDAKDLPKECNSDKGPLPGFCPHCPYKAARDRASVHPTFFNPYSLFFFNLTQTSKQNIMVVDEAHNIVNTVNDMSGRSYNSAKYTIPISTADLNVDEWLQWQTSRLTNNLKAATNLQERVRLQREIDTMLIIRESYAANPENFAVEIKELSRTRSLTIAPIHPPRQLMDRLLSSRKLILLSATLLPSDVREIVGHDDFEYLSLPSPIDKSRRHIQYAPAPFPMNSKTEPSAIARQIEKILEKHPGENAIVHLTYSMAEKVSQHLRLPHLRNTSENKNETIARFKSEGGLFLASGCNEGLDLPGDECRVNIIPMLHRLNPTDPVVRKRLGLPGGRDWYNERTLVACIQQAGRSTRTLSDYSITYVLDPSFPRLIMDKKLDVPTWFKEAVLWR